MRPTPKTITAIINEIMIDDKTLNMKTLETTKTGVQIRKSGKVPTVLDARRTSSADTGTTVLSYTRNGINVTIIVTDTPEEEEKPDLNLTEVLKVFKYLAQEVDVIVYPQLTIDQTVRSIRFEVFESDRCVFYGGLGFASL